MSDKKIFSYGRIFRAKKIFFFISRGMKTTTHYRKYFYDFCRLNWLVVLGFETLFQSISGHLPKRGRKKRKDR